MIPTSFHHKIQHREREFWVLKLPLFHTPYVKKQKKQSQVLIQKMQMALIKPSLLPVSVNSEMRKNCFPTEAPQRPTFQVLSQFLSQKGESSKRSTQIDRMGWDQSNPRTHVSPRKCVYHIPEILLFSVEDAPYPATINQHHITAFAVFGVWKLRSATRCWWVLVLPPPQVGTMSQLSSSGIQTRKNPLATFEDVESGKAVAITQLIYARETTQSSY